MIKPSTTPQNAVQFIFYVPQKLVIVFVLNVNTWVFIKSQYACHL
jgi:hypothetical protein